MFGLASALSISVPLRLLMEENREIRQEARDLWGLAHAMKDGKPWLAPGGWALGADALICLLREIDSRNSQVIVELGPGASSVILAASTSAHLIGLEHDKRYVDLLSRQLASNAVENYELLHAQLETQRYGDDTVEWYGPHALAALPSRIDVLIVDGPPNHGGGRNRSLAWSELGDRIPPGGIVLIDDTHRSTERTMASEWLADDRLDLLHDGDTFMVLEVSSEASQ